MSMNLPANDLPKALASAQQQLLAVGLDDFASWASMELSGYPSGVRVPEYRKIAVQARGKISNDTEVIDNQPLPVWHLAGDWTQETLRLPIHQIVAALENRAPCVRFPIDNVSLALFTRGLRMGSGFRVTDAWWEIQTVHLERLVDGVRKQLRLAREHLEGAPGAR
ncbi:hypothetical protein CLH61_07750 [Marinobacter profundi]|uniref:AbiTii domain-containing protein n=2 Tax=Marinobacteraceae TaxID=2887365 RepID=A0A2G1UM59_9GAMM|nr:hypothetical protein CLH61_07750 [Marinobacter profundi]